MRGCQSLRNFLSPCNLHKAVGDASLFGEDAQGSTGVIAAGYNQAKGASHGQHCQWGMKDERAVVGPGNEDS
jgi:hypothetical protein